MRVQLVTAACAALGLCLAAPSFAQAPAKAPAKDAAPKKEEAKAPEGPRRDPAGITGISPYMEAVKKGEDAYVARDFKGAIAAFQEAIKLDIQNALAYYRMGEAQLADGNLAEAEAQWQSAMSRTGSLDLKAKIHFVLADLKERQGKWQEAKDAWNAYQTFLQNNPKALGYAASAIERIKQIDRRVKDEKDYGEVKARTKKREEEKIKEAEENAKKDTKNK